MSPSEGFLARWSRLKRRSAAPPAEPKTPAAAAPESAPAGSDPIAEPGRLPAIEALDATSDITPFLAPGVPLELTRQALRRAWTADPAIRDFVGLSENAWDFTAAGGVPGFGSLSAEDVSRLLQRAMGGADPAADTGERGAEEKDRPAGGPEEPKRSAANAAVQQEEGEAETDRSS